MHMHWIHLFYMQKEWEPYIGSHSDGSSHALGMFLAVYIPELILQEISGTVWFRWLGIWVQSGDVMYDVIRRQKDRFLKYI